MVAITLKLGVYGEQLIDQVLLLEHLLFLLQDLLFQLVLD
jgi:hypothetical protein